MEVYDCIYSYLECLQNAEQAAQDISMTVGKPNVKLAINILAQEMVNEEVPLKISIQASMILLAMANSHFNDVMYELQRNMKTGMLPHHMVLTTLGSLASHYALKCIPFLSLTFVYIRMILRMPMISHMKESVCFVMESFCTAINFYYKNWKMCSFPREAEAQLCAPVIPIYQCLVSDWMNDEETKVKEASVKAQWPMLGVLVRRIEQQDEIIRNIPKVLMDSRVLDSFYIAKRLNLFLDVCEECKPAIPKKIFQALCDFVFKQVLPLDTPLQKKPQMFSQQDWKPTTQVTTVGRQDSEGESAMCDLSCYEHQEICKDHRSMLMDAFGHLVSCCPVDAQDFLQSQMKDATEDIRVGFLNNLKIIVSHDVIYEARNRKRPVVEAVKCLLDDHSEMVRKAILCFIKELLRSQSVEGCAVWDMIDYIFKQFTMSISLSGKDPVAIQKEKLKEEHIQDMCIDVLEHVNASAEGMSKALWPKLLVFVVPAPYTRTLIPLCRCLKELAILRPDESTLFLGSCKGVNLPSAQGLIARLLVLASNPNQRGGWALQLLHILHTNIHPAVRKLWAKQIPFLWESFQGRIETSREQWEQKLLQFLRRSLETIDDSTWTQNLSRELETQITSYADGSTEKSFLCKCWGISLTSCEDLTFVQSTVQNLVENADYMKASERDKVIQILSFSAMGHLDLTLAILHEFGVGVHLTIKISMIINRYKDYYRGSRKYTHQTLMLTYGKVALRAPKELLLSRVEESIMKKVLYHYRSSCQVLGLSIENKDMNLKLALVQSTTDICQAIHETRSVQNFTLSCKKELLGILLDFIREEPLDSLTTPLRPKAIIAMAFLSKLKPSLNMEDIRNLLDQSIKSLFPLRPLEQLKLKGETERDALHIESLYTDSMDAFGKLVKSMVEEHPNSELMDEMFQLIDPWFTEKEWSRERALQAIFHALVTFQENVYLPEGENFQQFGSRVAFLAPYTCDNSIQCRQWAAQCITCLIRIQARSQATCVEAKEMESAYANLQTEVFGDLLRASSKMAKVVSAYFPPDQGLDFVKSILEVLVSGNKVCVVAAGHWLLTILQDCGNSMKGQISAILDVFYSHLPIIKQDDLRPFLMDALSIVAHFHLDAVFNSLLCRHLPMDSETGELWRSLGRDTTLALLILPKLASTITKPTDSGTIFHFTNEDIVEFADEDPLKATCAVYEILSVLQGKKALQQVFPDLFCALLWQVSKTLGQKMPLSEGQQKLFLREQMSEGNPCRLSVSSLKALVLQLTCDPSLAEISEVNIWALLRDPKTHQEGVCLLTRCLFQNRLLHYKTIQNILPWINSDSQKLRLTGTAFLTEVVQDPILIEKLQIKFLLPTLMLRAGDWDPGIRQMAIRSLGNLLLVAPDKMKGQKRTIVAVLIGALYDEKLVLESLRLLALIFPRLKGKDVGFLFKDISLKTTSYFAEDNADLREAALCLFGILAAWTKFRYKRFFTIQARRNLVSLLIHQRDPNPKVSETCRTAFLQCVKFLVRRKLRIYIEELYCTTNLTVPNLHTHVCRQMIENINPEMRKELLKKTMIYFQSNREEIQIRGLELTEIILESMRIADLDEQIKQVLLTSLVRLQKNTGYGFNEHLDVPQASAAVEAYIIQKWGENLSTTESYVSGSNGIQTSTLSSVSQLEPTLNTMPV
ncbi:maestro heat-like repeat-containing protein family member 2B [Erythrolamprus reginae]|uniref:maestro heat-like repeat-containing protein family member 2B n=1 Tax=Erythrolamprus reginae TaxID=121349 RepID=UPI00396C7D0C